MTDLHDEHVPMSTSPTPSTGHPAIDEALKRLEHLDDVDLSLHPEQFDAIHGVLRESLANAGRDGADVESA
jgi:hypothetical protein